MSLLHTLHTHTEPYGGAEVLKKEFPGGVDLVYEGVGGDMFKAALDNLAPNGRLLVVGYISQYPHEEGAAPNPMAEELFW